MKQFVLVAVILAVSGDLAGAQAPAPPRPPRIPAT